MEDVLFEPIDLREIESMAESAVTIFHTVPEEFFYDHDLASKLIEPIKKRAEVLLGPWACRVITTSSLGCNIDGISDHIAGEDWASFFGHWVDVDVHAFQSKESNPLTEDLDGKLVPSLVFETFDDDKFDGTIAQTYLHVAVPLLGTLVDIQRYGLVYNS